ASFHWSCQRCQSICNASDMPDFTTPPLQTDSLAGEPRTSPGIGVTKPPLVTFARLDESQTENAMTTDTHCVQPARRPARVLPATDGGQHHACVVLLMVGVMFAEATARYAAADDSTPASASATAPMPQQTDYSAALEMLAAAVRHEVQQKILPAFSIAIIDDQRVVWADG